MLWSNSVVQFIIGKLKGYGIAVYFYSIEDDILLISTGTKIAIEVIILLREDIALYLKRLGYNFILRVSNCETGLKVVIKEGVLSE